MVLKWTNWKSTELWAKSLGKWSRILVKMVGGGTPDVATTRSIPRTTEAVTSGLFSTCNAVLLCGILACSILCGCADYYFSCAIVVVFFAFALYSMALFIWLWNWQHSSVSWTQRTTNSNSQQAAQQTHSSFFFYSFLFFNLSFSLTFGHVCRCF